MRYSPALRAVMLAVAVLPANGQISTSSSATGNEFVINVAAHLPIPIPQMAGAPYSGQQTDQSIQTLPDGSRITHSVGSMMCYRDSIGRVRTEQPMFPSRQAGWDSTLVAVLDPVAGYYYLIDSANQMVHRMKAQGAGPVRPWTPSPKNQTSKDGAQLTVEPLGNSTISGIAVVGFKSTTTYPASSHLGNDRLVTGVAETWHAPSLGLIISSTYSHADTVDTMTMQNLSTTEPDPALFTIPAGYKLVDETGGFTIKVTRQN